MRCQPAVCGQPHKLLAALDLDLCIHLEPHDDVLDSNYAAMTPAQGASTDARHEAMAEAA